MFQHCIFLEWFLLMAELLAQSNLTIRMALVDQWKARKREDHKEVMKRARKASELRQVIMCVKNDLSGNTL